MVTVVKGLLTVNAAEADLSELLGGAGAAIKEMNLGRMNMAATLVRPGTQVVSISGDGGFLFSAQELETATRLGLSFTHVIMRDNTYDMVGFQEELKYGRKSGVQLAEYDVAHYAAAFGATGVRVSGLADFESAFKESLCNPGITIIDVCVDYRSNTDLAKQLHDDVLE